MLILLRKTEVGRYYKAQEETRSWFNERESDLN